MPKQRLIPSFGADARRDIISFSGSDTLCLARFIQDLLSMKDVLRHCLLYIQGRHTRTGKPVMLIAAPTASRIDGYVRCLYVRVLQDVANTLPEHIVGAGRDIDVGCTNATKEEIAASWITLYAFSLHHCIDKVFANAFIRYYSDNKGGLDRAYVPMMDFLHADMQHHKRIGGARREILRQRKELTLKDSASKLASYLTQSDSDYTEDVRAAAIDSFRLFEDKCMQYPRLSEHITDDIIKFIEDRMPRGKGAPRWQDSVVYAIESLGFVANNQRAPGEKASKLLWRILTNDQCRKAHRHVLWASLVALDRIGPPKCKPSSIERLTTRPGEDIPEDVFACIKSSIKRQRDMAACLDKHKSSMAWMPLKEMILKVNSVTRPLRAAREESANRRPPSKRRLVVFLGAGASATSHISTAKECISYWKWEICNKLDRRKHAVPPSNLADRSVQAAFDRTLDTYYRELKDAQLRKPDPGEPEEYSFYAGERKRLVRAEIEPFFKEQVRRAVPSIGYEFLGLLAKEGIVDSIWTTNFDSLSAKTALDGVCVFEVGLDSWRRLPDKESDLAVHEILHVSLHGDYRYDRLVNTPQEFRDSHEVLLKKLQRRLRNRDLIVIGYSGRDNSVMEALTKAYSVKGKGRLFWCGYDQEQPIPASVMKLLKHARTRGPGQSFYVPTPGFDETLKELAWKCLPIEVLQRALT